MIDFTGKTALITGGTRGIGLAAALGFAKAGANVAITHSANSDAAKAAKSEIEGLGVECICQQLRTTDEQGHGELIRLIVERWGSLDVAVSNAGIWNEASIDEMSGEQFREMMEVNMTGSFILAKHATRQMKQQGAGSMVFISSTAGQRGEAHHSHYAAAKGAQISFTKSLASELAVHGIRVNCVAPGWVDTDMTHETISDPEFSQKLAGIIPIGRAGRPEEIANAILFLSSPLASFITGEILNVNGGAVLCG